MANVSYDLMWREAMAELLDLLETEHPEDKSLAPKELGEWACVYVKYLQIMGKLEAAFDQMVHPQKRAVSGMSYVDQIHYKPHDVHRFVLLVTHEVSVYRN